MFLPLFAASVAFMAFVLWPRHRFVQEPLLRFFADLDSRWIIASFAAALFVCCMVCHGELARLKPHPRYLTGFYVTVSLGGAIGGIVGSSIALAASWFRPGDMSLSFSQEERSLMELQLVRMV